MQMGVTETHQPTDGCYQKVCLVGHRYLTDKTGKPLCVFLYVPVCCDGGVDP